MLAVAGFFIRVGSEPASRALGQAPGRRPSPATSGSRPDRAMSRRVVPSRAAAMADTPLGLGQTPPRLREAETRPAWEDPAPVAALPYAALIRAHLAAGDVHVARTLLDAALRGPIVSDELRRLKKVMAPPRVSPSDTIERERCVEYGWLAQHGGDFSGEWVALDGERVLAHGHSLKEVLAAVKAMRLDRMPLVHRVE